MDHIDQAIHTTVHDSDIPAKDIAQRLGMSHQVLINKANPQSEFHKLTLREALALQLITGSRRILQAMDTELSLSGGVNKSKGLLESVLAASREHGDVVRAVQEALEDNRFTLRERELCQKEIDEAVNALHELRASVVNYGK